MYHSVHSQICCQINCRSRKLLAYHIAQYIQSQNCKMSLIFLSWVCIFYFQRAGTSWEKICRSDENVIAQSPGKPHLLRDVISICVVLPGTTTTFVNMASTDNLLLVTDSYKVSRLLDLNCSLEGIAVSNGSKSVVFKSVVFKRWTLLNSHLCHGVALWSRLAESCTARHVVDPAEAFDLSFCDCCQT